MRGILISIQPQWVEKILNGEKTIEIRKTKPKCELPVKVYIYCTKAIKFRDVYLHELKKVKGEHELGLHGNNIMNGKVVAEFVLNNVDEFYVFENGNIQDWNANNLYNSLLTYNQLSKYIGKNNKGYAWHIEDLKIYDKPRELGEFWVKRKCTTCFDTGYESSACVFDEDCMIPVPLTKAPQSWCYVKGESL